MVMHSPRKTREPAPTSASAVAAVRDAFARGLMVGRQVKIGVVRGVVIGYNIGRRGRYPGRRYPLLVKTELGVVKCGLGEVLGV